MVLGWEIAKLSRCQSKDSGVVSKSVFVLYQFALTLACGLTVHHSQGSTSSEIAIDLQKTTASPGSAIPRATHHVSTSRNTSLSATYNTNFNIQDLRADENVEVEVARLRTNVGLRLAFPTFPTSAQLSL